MDNNKEYILCAAIKRIEPLKITPYHKNDITQIELGFRHFDILQRFQGIVSKNQQDQGFYTSDGRFVDRIEAMKIAFNAGQVSEKIALRKWPNDRDRMGLIDKYMPLFSEHLY